MPAPDYFFVRERGGYAKVITSTVIYIEARRNYAKIVTSAGDHLVSTSLKRCIRLLEGGQFCHIHRGFVINLDYLNFFDRKLAHMPDKLIPIGEMHYERLRQTVIAIGSREMLNTLKVQL